MSLVLRDYQQEAIDAAWEALGRGMKRPLLVEPTGCHAKGTRVIMADGSLRNVEDIAVGDLLMGPDSRPRTVLNLYRGQDAMYRITPTKGEPFVVNAGHVLNLASTNEGKASPSARTGAETVNIQVSEYLKKSNYFRHVHKLHRAAIDFPERPVDGLDPYAMGAFLGDGHIGENVLSISSADPELLEYVDRVMHRYCSRVRRVQKGRCWHHHYSNDEKGRKHGNFCKDMFARFGLVGKTSGEKFIPDAYRLGSRETRLAMLAGLLDTDGSLSRAGFDYISKSKQLADDVAFICRSLGLAAYVKECTKTSQYGTSGQYHRVSISGDCSIIPTKIPRKKAPGRQQVKRANVTGFKIEPVGRGDYYGFELDGDHLYLTEDFIVHHNSGKALILASLCKQAWEMDPTVRVVILVDSEELVSQNFQEFIGIWPEAPAGIYCAGLNRRQIGAQFLFASIASIYKKAYAIQRCDILLIDECHMIPRRSDAMYGRFIGDLETINPRLAIIGATATPFRLDSGKLHQGEDALFDGIAHETTALRLIEEGYLCPPRTWQQADIKTDGIGKRAGEFIVAQLEAAAMDEAALEQTVEHIIQAGEPRQAWKIFGVSVAHCEALHARLEARGYRGGCVFGETDKTERRRNIARFDSGELRYLISNMALVKGFNVKRIDLVVLAFSTLSPVKYIQTIGRGTRPLYAPGYDLSTREGRLAAIDSGPKPYCYVLDLGQNVTRHGPFDDPFVAEKKKGNGKGEAPVRECPECKCTCGTMNRSCPACGHEFPPPERAISLTPDSKPILSQPPEWLAVAGVSYRRHEKAGSLPTMRVEYRVGLTVHKEWQCVEHSGYPRQKFEGWWLRRAPGPVPATVAEAIARSGELAVPDAIQVKREGKYDRVINHKFEAKKEAA